MPAFNTTFTRNLGVGEQIDLVATGETGITSTRSFAVGRDGAQKSVVTFFNSTDQSASIQASNDDVDADYLPVDSVSAGNVLLLETAGPFVRATFATAPASGKLVAAR